MEAAGMHADELAVAVGSAAAAELSAALGRIKHCVSQLRDEQIWFRPQPQLNTIGNLILHLCGNIRQWLTVGLGGGADDRKRPAEFAERGPIPGDELIRRLESAVAEARAVLVRQSAADLLRIRHIQEDDVSGLAAIFNSVPHFRGHTQEIIHLTRLQLGDAYQFAWKPHA
jgi:hypothetical protein